MFNREKCFQPQIYCGKKETAPNGYIRKGDSYECLKKGFGTGYYKARSEGLSKTSLKRLKYVSDKDITLLESHKIYSQISLKNVMKKMSVYEKMEVLDGITKRGRNSILLFLDDNNVKELPECL